MNSCNNMQGCTFYKKYKDSTDTLCRGFIQSYCLGYKQTECIRKEHLLKSGKRPVADMLPNGNLYNKGDNKSPYKENSPYFF